MGISLNNIGYPVITCDHCGEKIKKSIQGIITFDVTNIHSKLIPAHMYHNGDCDQKERYSMEIHEYLSYLLQDKYCEGE